MSMFVFMAGKRYGMIGPRLLSALAVAFGP